MILNKLAGGWQIIVPESANNSEFRYEIPIATDGPKEIGERQLEIARKVALLCFAMENFFKTLPTDWTEYWKNNTQSPFDKWNEKNKMDFTEFFHWGCQDLENEAFDLMTEYADWHFQTYGWTGI